MSNTEESAATSNGSRPTALPGRVYDEIAELAELLHDAESHHGAYEAASDPHNWWDWYAAYVIARSKGNAPDDAERSADAYMVDVKGVAVHR